MKKNLCFVILLIMTTNVSCQNSSSNVSESDVPSTQMETTASETTSMFEEVGQSLLDIMKKTSDHQVEEYQMVDMNHDGAEELVGVFEEDSKYHIWYCNSDGTICKEIGVDDNSMDDYELSVIELDDSTHIVFYTYRSAGTMKNSMIFALENMEIKTVFDDYGCVSQNDAGDILLNVEAYDGMYDASVGTYMVHTYKDTYLFYEDGKYKEYGATIIPESEFNSFQNATKLKEEIASEYADNSVEYTYFKRKNGIIHIQCAIALEGDSIEYKYYTVYYDEDVIKMDSISRNDGIMDKYFSNLEVVYN